MSVADRLHQQAVQALQSGDPARAEQLLKQAIDAHRRHGPAQVSLGLLLARQGRLTEAVDALSMAVKINPKDATGHFNLGSALKQLGRSDQALRAYARAVQLAPHVAATHNGLGVALRDAGRYDQAATALGKALSIDPNLAEAHNNLGTVRKAQGRLADATDHYQKALAIQPDMVEALGNLGNALTESGDFEGALNAYQSALTRQPNHAETHYNLANTLVEQGELDAAEQHFHQALAHRPNHPHAARNLLFMSCYNPRHSPADVLDRHRQWGEGFEQVADTPTDGTGLAYANTPDPERPLRVGLVSADFRKHAVSSFIAPLLAGMDRTQITTYGYANVVAPDHHTDALKKQADGWRDISRLSDQAAADRIRADRIDILIDLGGHTANSRLPLFRFRPAPIQASYLGYPATTGTGYIDVRLTDERCDPAPAHAYYVERLAYFDSGFCAFQPPEKPPDVAPSPALANGVVTFGSMLNLSKINTATIALWARVLQAVPDARLFILRHNLKVAATRKRYLGAFAKHGIDASRITLEWQFENSHLDQYRHMDIALDSLPFCSHTSNCEGLWMGVPTLTLAGDYFAGRMGVSINQMANLPDWIVTTADDYVALAQAKAADIGALADLRTGVRAQVQRSRLTDGRAVANDFADTLRGLWRSWCQGR